MKPQDRQPEWEAVELFCPTCRRAVPVRKKMLLVLAEGDKYDYLCTVCGAVIGAKLDKKEDALHVLLPPLKP